MKSHPEAESSIGLRVITSAMALVGILAACQLAETPLGLTMFGISGTVIGSIVSYLRRKKNNFWIKWALAAGIFVVLGLFVEEIIYRIQSSIADARAPLTNMLIALQALHSFDLPKRRDLNVSALVGLVLLSSAATLSRDLSFGLYLLVFIAFGAYMLYLDCQSRSLDSANFPPSALIGGLGTKAERLKSHRILVAFIVVLMPALSLATFFLLPKIDIGLLRNVRVSINLKVPFLRSGSITNPLLSRSRRGDGSLEVNPFAYFGFNEELDLNYRGELSNQIVLKVASTRGQLWRAMAFDTYDGHGWTMSQANTTFDRLTMYGSAIPLDPLPSMSLPRRVPIIELTQVFHLEADQPNLIPAATVPYLIYFPTNKVLVDTYGSLRSPVIMEKDMVYTVFSHVPMYDLSVLRGAPLVPPSAHRKLKEKLFNYLALPAKLPSGIANLANDIAGKEGNWFTKAERINNFLKLNFHYDLKVPPTPMGQDTVADFLLKRKSGYCEHFASAFVVLCRTQGIPARLVTGFIPGEYNPFTGLWEVRMRDAHAWAEVFIPRWGWVTFDPTPDGVPPAFTGHSGQSALSFLSSQICSVFGSAFERLAKNQTFILFVRWLAQMLSPLAWLLNWLAYFTIAVWKPVVLVMILTIACVAALLVLRPLLALHTKYNKNQPLETSQDPKRGEATREFLKVMNDLSSLKITRLPQDTVSDLKNRLAEMKLPNQNQIEELTNLIGHFLDSYAKARFGNSASVDSLPELSNKIRAQVLSLSRK